MMAEVRVRKFIKDSVILAASNAGVRAVNFLLLPVYTRALTPDAYGVNDIVITFASLLAATMSMQMDWGLQAFFYDEDGSAYLTRLVSTCLAFCLSATAVALLAIALAAPLARVLVGSRSYSSTVAFGLGLTGFCIISAPLAAATRMNGRVKAVAVFNLINVVLLMLMTLIAIFVFRLGASSIVFATLVATAVTALLYCVENRWLISASAVDFALMKRLLACSAPVVLTAALDWANVFSDRYVIACFRSPAEVGLYGIGTRLTGVILVFAWGWLMAYGPFASANARNSRSRPKYRLAFDLTAMFLASVCFAVSAFSKDIVTLMTAPEYHGAYLAVPALLYGMAFYVLAVLVGYSFTIKKVGKNYLFVNFVCVVANLALNIAFVPRYGYAAAAFTTLLSYALMFALTLRLGERIFPCGFDVIRLLLVTLVPGAAVGFLFQTDNLSLKSASILAVVAYVAFVYAGRVLLLYENGREWLIRKGRLAFNG